MRLWQWALEVYARPSVAGACLTLQDAHGQNVPYLLWAAWRAWEGRPADLDRAAALVRRWEAEVGAPLRAARRATKPSWDDVSDEAREDFRAVIKTAELQGEKVLMESLEALAGDPGPTEPLLEALTQAATALGDAPPEPPLRALAESLS